MEELKKAATQVSRKDLGLIVAGKIAGFGTSELCKESAVQEL